MFIGAISIATDQSDAAWARPITPTGIPSTLTQETVASKRVQLIKLHATTGAATTFSAVVDIQCL